MLVEKYVIMKMMITILMSGLIFAQRTLESQYPTIEGVRPETTAFGLPAYVKYVFNFSLWAAGLIIFLVLVYAGIRYLTSAGNSSRQRDAKDRIIAAFLGLAVLLLSYLILTTINPQLVILNLSLKTALNTPPITNSQPAEPKTLYYTGIPVGGIIDQLFLKERLLKIDDLSERLKRQAEKVSNLSIGLKSLTDACSCSIVDIGSCALGSCGGDLECANNCYCAGEPRGDFDPCPTRASIDAKREELKTALNEAEIGLKDRQIEFEKEIVPFRKLYNDLLSAEQIIKSCKGVGLRGGVRFLSNYSDFLEYIDRLREVGTIEKLAPDLLFGDIPADSPYRSATFYCAESSIPAQQVDPRDISQIELKDIDEEQILFQETYCGKEIPIGEAMDNAEELARRILAEMDNINSNTLGEINGAVTLSDLPENCVGSNCSSNMNSRRDCCAWDCAECCEPPPEPEPEPQPQPQPGICFGEECDPFGNCMPVEVPCPGTLLPLPGFGFILDGLLAFFLAPPEPVFAQGCQFGCCREACVFDACTGCGCSCTGSPCPASIGTLVSAIIANFSQINNSQRALADLINERVEEKLRISSILKALDTSNKELGACYTIKEMYARFENGEETDWESIASCSEMKDNLSIGLVFQDENGNDIKQCYGPDNAKPDLMDNFFCCFTSIPSFK